MTDSPAFLERLAKVPSHVMLTPGVHLYKNGDEWIDGALKWGPVNEDNIGRVINVTFQPIVRRSIPEHIRRSAAWWGLYTSLATVAPDAHGTIIVYEDAHERLDIIHGGTIKFKAGIKYQGQGATNGLRKFQTVRDAMNAVPILGGEETIIKHLSEGDLMSVWMGEQ